jgi:arylsulfatase A
MSNKPNIIFIFCDDLGWGDVSCLNPDSRIHTPHIDQLAARGMNFTDAHAGSAVCTPSRYTLMTGRYCWRTNLKQGVNNGYSPALIREGRLTVPAMLKQEGYKSACIGKWHIGMDWTLKPEYGHIKFQQDMAAVKNMDQDSMVDFSQPIKNGPLDAGFDYYFGIAASLDMTPYVFIENNKVQGVPDSISPAGTTPESRAREGICTSGWRHEDVLPALKKHSLDFINAQAIEGNPFFLYMPVNGPHTPVVPNKEFLGKSGCGIYGDFVMEIDHVVGEIVKRVDDLGIREDTMILFSSDNGPETLTAAYREQFNHFSAWKFRGMKRDNWEGGHRIPYIVSWPGTVQEGARCDQFVELADFFATASAVAQSSYPSDQAEDSYNMLPLLLGDRDDTYRDFAIHHSCDGKWAIRKGQWKMLLHSGSAGNRDSPEEEVDPVQLYDLSLDPYETSNLFKEFPDKLTELKDLCLRVIQRGRSTPGEKIPLEEEGSWKQLEELLSLSW